MPESPTVLPPLAGWTKGKMKRYFEDYGHTLAVKATKAYDSDFYDVMHVAVPDGHRVANLYAGWWWTHMEHLDSIVEHLGDNVSKVTFRRTS